MKLAIYPIYLIIFTITLTQSKGLYDNFNTSDELDQIEGVWSLNVISTLTINETSYTKHDNNYSEWLIIRDGNRYDIRSMYDEEMTFNASFEKIDLKKYIYRCNYYDPKWKIITTAFMPNENIIQYSYYANKAYLKKIYGKDYQSDMTLHWKFRWIKVYPKAIKT